MEIFKAEAGINKLLDNKTIAYTTAIKKYTDKYPDIRYLCLNKELNDIDKVVLASIKDNDLYYHTSILVTTSWNKNDDIFTPETVWAARNTPVDKPTNLEHDNSKIVGHMTNSWAIDLDGNIIEEEEDLTSLPSKYHILVGSVIYKLWDGNEEYQEKVNSLLQEIEDGKKYVSLECHFSNFDYALANNKELKIVARNEETAFLTKHLRVYGGTGEFNNFKVGRVVRDITFCGKGYVDEPANPESIIFSEDEMFDFAKATFLDKIDEKTTFPTKSGVSSNNIVKSSKEPAIMSEFISEQNKELKAKNDMLEARVNELTEQFAKSNVAKLEKEIESLKAHSQDLGGDLKSKTEALEAKESETKTLQAKMDELVKVKEDLAKSNEELTTKINKVEAEQKTQTRISTFVEGGLSKEDAEKEVTNFAELNDKQFESVANRIIEAAKFVMKEDEKKKKDEKKTEAKIDEKTVDSSKVTDEEITSANVVEDKEDEIHASLVKNLTAALKTSNKENGDK